MKIKLSRPQQGVIGIVALMFILIVTLFAMSQAATISASNVSDSARQADGVEALFLAESAIEYAGGLYVSQATPDCTNTAHTGVGTTVSMGRGSYTIVAAYSSGFGGSGILSTSPYQDCRIRVKGAITSTGVTRYIDTIVSKQDDEISIASLNPNFNDPLWGCNTSPATCNPVTETRDNDFAHGPNQWSLVGGNPTGLPYIGWDKQGGPDGSRSAFARKTKSGSGTLVSGGAFNLASPIPINVNTSKVLRLTFDFRVWTRGGSFQEMSFSPVLTFNDHITNSNCTTKPGTTTPIGCTPDTTILAGGDCASSSSVGWCESACTMPSNCASQPSQSTGSGPTNGCGYIDTTGFETGPGTTGYSSCSSFTVPSGSTGYKTGYVSYTIYPPAGQTSGTVHLTGIKFEGMEASPVGRLSGKSGQITWIWIDNLRLSVPGVNGGGPSKLWREVASTSS
jgi:hypothetical protein